MAREAIPNFDDDYIDYDDDDDSGYIVPYGADFGPINPNEIKYITPVPKTVFDTIYKIFCQQKSFDKKYKLFQSVTQHKFSHALHDKEINKETFFYDRDYL